METIIYESNFEKFVESCIQSDKNEKDHYVGLGNPNAHILLIGKEAAQSEGDELYITNAKEWKEHIEKGTRQINSYSIDEQNPLYSSWGHNTWSFYQKLIDMVKGKMGMVLFAKPTPKYVDFLENVFTTEINDSPSKKTITADKTSIKNRKALLKCEYIQSFSVVILACSNYIQNNDEVREIDDIFDVRYDGDETGKYLYSETNWFYTHHDAMKKRLVIHTRQLSCNVMNELLENMSDVIAKHLLEHNISLVS